MNDDHRDAADRIAAAWNRERPGTSTESIGIVTRLWQLAKIFGEDRRRVLAAAGVDTATLDLLSVLRRSSPPYTLSTRELAERTLVTPGAISQRVTRAERDGLVARRREPGGRTVWVELTPAGHALVERTVDLVLDRELELLDSLDAEQRQRLAELLRVLLRDVQIRTGYEGLSQVGDAGVG
ncbi:MarR family transcriptional regulator [Nocardia sp. CDC159]|uniref:MarR family transcriptional regulator n=1 Tax=Nocardia pulmonis TaxID=2951408 RepID=A0A9X2IWW5_9NOCA|nr:MULTISPECIES: MarR family transcriptional regulator [Nocardia]MCM6774773.1 MarR family transcriptional regulator [Nocardia pulmonis]MCM6789704.1 MarR family transcriptional regulator [Nocardia sp. CDC159]